VFFFQDEEIEMIYFLWILYFAGRSLTMTANDCEYATVAYISDLDEGGNRCQFPKVHFQNRLSSSSSSGCCFDDYIFFLSTNVIIINSVNQRCSQNQRRAVGQIYTFLQTKRQILRLINQPIQYKPQTH